MRNESCFWGQNVNKTDIRDFRLLEEIRLTGVDAGAGGRDAELRLDELWDEGDESGDDGAFCRVRQTDEQEGHVAEDPHRRFGQVWKTTGGQRETFYFVLSVPDTLTLHIIVSEWTNVGELDDKI